MVQSNSNSSTPLRSDRNDGFMSTTIESALGKKVAPMRAGSSIAPGMQVALMGRLW